MGCLGSRWAIDKLHEPRALGSNLGRHLELRGGMTLVAIRWKYGEVSKSEYNLLDEGRLEDSRLYNEKNTDT